VFIMDTHEHVETYSYFYFESNLVSTSLGVDGVMISCIQTIGLIRRYSIIY
jgi:hypothetical protein